MSVQPAFSRRRFLIGSAGVASASVLPLVVPGALESAAAGPAQVLPESTLLIDDTSTAIVYEGTFSKFANLNTANWYNGHASSSKTKNDSFSYTHHECTRLRWRSTKDVNRGIATVYIDGAKVGSVDTYAAAVTPSAVQFDSGELPAGKHTISVVVSGKKNASSSGLWVECDAFEIVAVAGTVIQVDDTDPTMFFNAAYGAPFTNVTGRLNGTAHSTIAPNATFSYVHPNCTRLVLYSGVGPNHGQADIYLDNILAGTYDQYRTSADSSVAVYDSGILPAGSHSIKVVTKGTGHAGATSYWFEVDYLQVTCDSQGLDRVNDDNANLIKYQGTWQATTTAPGAVSGDAHYTDAQGATASFTFLGDTVRWIGCKQSDGGIAQVWIDGVLDPVTVDTYAATTQRGQVIYEKTGLSYDRSHTIRVVVTGAKNASASAAMVYIDAFDTTRAYDTIAAIARQANAEVALIAAGTKPYFAPST